QVSSAVSPYEGGQPWSEATGSLTRHVEQEKSACPENGYHVSKYLLTMKRLIFLLIVVAGVAGGYYAMHRAPGAVTLTGIWTTQDVVVSPQLGGQIGQLLVKEGDTVQKGQLIAVLTREELEADRAYYARQGESIPSQVGGNAARPRVDQR